MTKKKFRGPTRNQATDLSDSASECCTLLMTGRSLSLYVILNRHTAGMSNVEIPAWLNRKRKLLNFKLVTEIKKDPRSSFAIQFKYLSLFHLCILYFLQVRNKLDNCLYAVKRIPLNPKSTQLNKRIMREVQLISRLNHENVVRWGCNGEFKKRQRRRRGQRRLNNELEVCFSLSKVSWKWIWKAALNYK